MSGTRKLATFGTTGNRTLLIDMGANPVGTAWPTSGVLRFRNGSTACWENLAGTNGLCQSTDAKDRFSFDSGVVTPTYSTSTTCASFWGQCNNAAAGSVGLSLGANSTIVWTTAVTAQSQIFVQEDSTLGKVLGLSA